MAGKTWKIALGMGCAVVILAIVFVALLPLGFRWLEAKMQQRAAGPLTAIEMQECKLVQDGSSITVRGSLRNGGESTVRDVLVRLLWTDGSEEEITAGVEGVAPGETIVFVHGRENPGGALDGVDCLINCVRTQQAIICR